MSPYNIFIVKKVWFFAPFLLTLFVVYKTFPLRLISYDKVPAPGITFDEYAFAWMGKGFLQTGMPVSWTTNLGEYRKNYYNGNISGWGLRVDGLEPGWTNLSRIKKPAIATFTYDYGIGDRYIDLVQPYFDHPPLAGIIYSAGIPQNLSTLTDVKPADFRRANAAIGAVTALLLFTLALLLYSPWTGFLAVLVYSTIPTTLLTSRLTLAENIIVPFFLTAMIFLLLGLRQKKLWLLVLSGLFAGACTLAKFSGVTALAASLMVMFISKANRRQFISFSLAFLASVMPYLIYTQLLAPQLFWQVIKNQSARGNWGIINLIQVISRVNFSGFPIDGWWTGGLIAFFYLLTHKKHILLTAMGLTFLLIATLLGGDNNGWYFFPLGIFVSLSWAILITDIFTSPDIKNLAVFFLFAVMSSLYWGYLRINSHTDLSWGIRFIAAVFIGSGLLLPEIIKKYPFVKYLWFIFMIFTIHRLYLWNIRGFQFILSQWGKLPFPLMLP